MFALNMLEKDMHEEYTILPDKHIICTYNLQLMWGGGGVKVDFVIVF